MLSPRFKRHCHVLAFPNPSEDSMRLIFGAVVRSLQKDVEPTVICISPHRALQRTTSTRVEPTNHVSQCARPEVN